MADADVWKTGGSAHCQDCPWSTHGKNVLGNASQHAERTGHTVSGETLGAFEVGP